MVAEAAVRVVAVRVVAVRVVYLCLLERVVGVEQVSGLPAAAPQRELRARGLVVRRELTPFSATGFGARCWRHKTEGGRAKKTSTVAEWGATESLLRRMHAKTPVPAGQDTETEGKLPNGVVLSVVCAASGAMLVLFCLSARSGAAPGRPEAIIFDQSAESAGTSAPVAALLAGQQGQDLQPDGRERAQHAAEEAQRKAEEAVQDQIDAVAKAEDDVKARTGSSSPVLSESEAAQRDLEQAQAERTAQAEREAKAARAEQDARVATEKARLDAEEKARLEAEADAANPNPNQRAGSRAGDTPAVGKSDLSNGSRAADTASARAEDAPRTSAPAPAASAAATTSSPAHHAPPAVGQGWNFFQAAGFTLFAVVSNALHVAQEVATDPAWTLGLPIWAIVLIVLSSIALCMCCVHLCGGKENTVKARRRTALYQSMGFDKDFGAGQAQTRSNATPTRDRQQKAKFRHYGENAHGEGGKVRW